jgi:hypothetical protein
MDWRTIMGYNTQYSLTWDGQIELETKEWKELVSEVGEQKAKDLKEKGLVSIQRDVNPIAEWIASNDNARYALNVDGSTNEVCKWYDHEDDLKALSMLHKGIIFILKGEGEESGDIWIKYFLNGKVQEARATVTFEPCRLRERP